MGRSHSLVRSVIISLVVVVSACSNDGAGPGGIRAGGMAALPSSLIVVAGQSQVIAYDPTGKLSWTYSLPGGDTIVSAPVGALSSVTYIRGEKAIYAVGPNGQELWQAKHEDPEGKLKGFIALTDSTVAATRNDAMLICYGGDGKTRWTFAIPNGDYITAPPVVAASSLLYLRGSQKLYAVDSNGNLSWAADLPAN